MAHREIDNVVYVNFHTGKKTPPPQPEVLGEVQAPVVSPGARFRRFIHQRTDSGRVGRGRDYARSGAVETVEFRDHAIRAQVHGSQIEPFDVMIGFPRLAAADKTAVAQTIAELPQGLVDFQAGHFSPQLIDLLLVPDAQVLRTFCTCPDKVEVCKHVVAVADIAEQHIDRDPTVLLNLRGMHMLEVQESIHMLASMSATTRAKAPETGGVGSYEDFWLGGTLPPLPNITAGGVLEESDMGLLHQAMRMISYTAIDELAAISDLEDIYHHLMNPPAD